MIMIARTSLAMPKWLVVFSSKRSISGMCQKPMRLSSLQQLLSSCHMGPSEVRIFDLTRRRTLHGPSSLMQEDLHRFSRASASPSPAFRTLQEIRIFSTNIVREEEEEKQSNRAAFRATPIIPSILAYIEKIGVGMRPRRPKHARRKSLALKENPKLWMILRKQNFLQRMKRNIDLNG